MHQELPIIENDVAIIELLSGFYFMSWRPTHAFLRDMMGN